MAVRCGGPQSKTQWERAKTGVCPWSASTCQPEMLRCPRCNVSWCRYHFDIHFYPHQHGAFELFSKKTATESPRA